jgi:hypothetical protein
MSSGWSSARQPPADSGGGKWPGALVGGAAGGHGFVRVRDGHFVDGQGKRLRFLASNYTFGSCFPDQDTADLRREGTIEIDGQALASAIADQRGQF